MHSCTYMYMYLRLATNRAMNVQFFNAEGKASRREVGAHCCCSRRYRRATCRDCTASIRPRRSDVSQVNWGEFAVAWPAREGDSFVVTAMLFLPAVLICFACGWSEDVIVYLQIKLGILGVLGGDVFADADLVCHLIVASADTRHRCSIISTQPERKLCC